MTLYMIGLGLNDEKDITVKGLETIRSCEKIYLENYTSVLQCKPSKLERLYKKKLVLADRDLVENRAEEILEGADKGDVAFLVVGDVFSATTHSDLYLRARERGIKVRIVHNASIFNAVSEVGLELYKFGRTASIPFPQKNFFPETPYTVLCENLGMGLHTLLLLDLDPKNNRFMSVNEGIKYLLKVEEKKKKGSFTKKTHCIGCARIGSNNPVIIYGKAEELIRADFGKPPHCLIVPGKLHFVEKEVLKEFSKQ